MMTRAAVEDAFEEFIDDIVEIAYREFDVVAALRGESTAGGRFVSQLVKNSSALDRHVVRPELRAYKRDALRQFQPILDYAADPDADFADYRDVILDHDPSIEYVREDVPADSQQAAREAILDHHRSLGEAARPLVRSDHDEFWAAVEAELTGDEARSLIESHFGFTDPIRTHRNAFAYRTELDPGEVLGGPLAGAAPSLTLDYTDEVLRVMDRAERTIIDRTLSEVDRRYGE
jgi:hypothetical protein